MDEVELIAPAIEHLERIGVDHLLVCDMGSTDGTWEVLEQHRGEDVELLQLSNSDNGEEWDRANLALVRDAPADWVLFLDADELWLPPGGSLRECADLAENDVVVVDRHNVPLGGEGPLCPPNPGPDKYDEVFVYIDAPPDWRAHLEGNPTAPWISGVPLPKIIARRDVIEGFAAGMHDVRGRPDLRRSKACDTLIAHLPFTTLERFERKVVNIREVHRHHEEYASGIAGRHWLRWVRAADEGRLEEEFESQRVDDDSLLALRSAGRVTSVAQWIEYLESRTP
jgi:glycosyltransferase involved in cell wall biosynthesis